MSIFKRLSILFFLLFIFSAHAEPLTPLYLGANGGFGSTTWKGLVPTTDHRNVALNISAPTNVQEGGGVWGGVLGFEFWPAFAIEANYLVYPRAEVFFAEDSLFAFENDGTIQLSSDTETVSLMGKILLTLPRTKLRAYSSIGVGWIHRKDWLTDLWLVTPSFGAGFNYPIHSHWMTELAVNYMSGYGESELNPARSYIPFLYAVYFRLAYRV